MSIVSEKVRSLFYKRHFNLSNFENDDFNGILDIMREKNFALQSLDYLDTDYENDQEFRDTLLSPQFISSCGTSCANSSRFQIQLIECK